MPCCEHHADHDSHRDALGSVKTLASTAASTVMSLAADLAAQPSQWPRWAWVCLGVWVLVSCYFLLFAVAMYLQELKSYGGASRVSLPKMLAFSLTWMNGSLLSSALCIPDLLLGRRERAAEKVHYYGSIMGQLMFRILSKPPVVIGLENLPPDGEKGMVYVSNHQTSVDIALFYYIGAERKFSWVSKSTVFLIPGVGLLMKIAGYVALTRGNRDSVRKMFDDCKERLAAGWSVMIFPQGTRRRLKVLDFKDGAFQLAIDSNSVVVPFTLDLPENLFHGPKQRTKITVHEPIRPGDPAFKDVATLRKHCFDTVMGALPYAEGMLEEQRKQKEEAAAAAAAGEGTGSTPVIESKKTK
ncbi:unnamed protein product [Ectocarpus sp. 12 AP-2014]